MFYLECVDESTGRSHKMGDIYNDGCNDLRRILYPFHLTHCSDVGNVSGNDCTCMESGVIQCTEKLKKFFD